MDTCQCLHSHHFNTCCLPPPPQMAMQGVVVLMMGLGLAAAETVTAGSGSYTAPEPNPPQYQVRSTAHHSLPCLSLRIGNVCSSFTPGNYRAYTSADSGKYRRPK